MKILKSVFVTLVVLILHYVGISWTYAVTAEKPNLAHQTTIYDFDLCLIHVI